MIIDPEYDMELAARRILWGKMINAGQVCISPDYVLVPRDKQDSLVAGLEKACVTVILHLPRHKLKLYQMESIFPKWLTYIPRRGLHHQRKTLWQSQ